MKLSMVLPVHNEADTLREFFGELLSTVEVLDFDIEIVFINDGSTDDSLAEMRRIKEEASSQADVTILDLARNFGHQAAVTAGIDFGEGAEGFLRFSYANSLENIDEALDRLEQMFRQRGWLQE